MLLENRKKMSEDEKKMMAKDEIDEVDTSDVEKMLENL